MSEPNGRLPDETWADVQGLITSGYGSLRCSAYLWLAIVNPGARRWLAEMLPLVRTSADALSSRESHDGGESALNLAFTAQGLAAMGLPDEVVRSFPAEFVEGIAAAERSEMLGDIGESAPEHWVVGGPSTPAVGAVLVVHGSTEEAVEQMCAEARRRFAVAAGAVFEIASSEQRGHRPPHHREPFGFRDGIAQPVIRGRKGHGVPTGEFILGYPNHYGFLPPTPVVPAALDPEGRLPSWPNPYHSPGSLRDLGRNGSYLVYRKLSQDVAGFWRFASAEAARLTAAGHAETAVSLASKMVGRRPDGTPLAGTNPPESSGAIDLDGFSYGHDPDGLACPWGAHIRRTHPRDAIKPYGPEASLNMSEAHRLLRRGRVFGPPLFDPEALDRADVATLARFAALQDDGRERGVHFLCINASIRGQFEFVQQSWCNNRHFAGLSDDKDPIAGDNGRPDWPSYMTLPRPEGAVRSSPLPRFVTVRGGAYLFVPSLAALRFLASMR
jgi:deferrochelatase/peroxidase EfeB